MARITEKLRVEVVNCDNIKNPFYIKWVNSKGALDYWMFDVRQRMGRTIANKKLYEPNYSDLENAETIQSHLSSESTPYVICSASGLTESRVKALLAMRESNKVFVLRDLANEKWEEILPQGGTYEYDNYSEGYVFEIRFNLQPRFIPSN